MSGVIDRNGQQWEHCNSCGEFVRIQDLLYEPPSQQYKYGRDLCSGCASPGSQPGKTIVISLMNEEEERENVRDNDSGGGP